MPRFQTPERFPNRRKAMQRETGLLAPVLASSAVRNAAITPIPMPTKANTSRGIERGLSAAAMRYGPFRTRPLRTARKLLWSRPVIALQHSALLVRACHFRGVRE